MHLQRLRAGRQRWPIRSAARLQRRVVDGVIVPVSISCVRGVHAPALTCNHALAALDSQTGVLIGELEMAADEDGHLRAMAWAAELDGELVWALEDCRHVAGRFERALIAAGQRVIRVAPSLTGASRRGERER